MCIPRNNSRMGFVQMFEFKPTHSPSTTGDNYNSGLSCQWVDVTDSPDGVAVLETHDNPDNFMCEGQIVLNSTTGEYIFDSTSFLNVNGLPQKQVRCITDAAAAANNVDMINIVLPDNGGTIVTSPCNNHEYGPLRNCGFNFVSKQVSLTPLHIR